MVASSRQNFFSLDKKVPGFNWLSGIDEVSFCCHQELEDQLQEEEDKVNHLNKVKSKLEQQIDEVGGPSSFSSLSLKWQI